MRIVCIPGYKATPESNFFPWLKDELRRRGHDVIIAILPNPETPDRDEWTKALLDQVGPIDSDTIVLGHSLGGAAALRFLEAAEARSTPHALVLVATPWMIQSEQFRGFFMTELDYEVLMWKAAKTVVMHAKDDPMIPFDHAEKYAKVLHARLIAAETGGHFQGEQYQIILDTVLALIDEPVVFEPGQTLVDEYADINR